jgi:transcriptional regulator with XRE-family HTH domain
MVPEMLWRDPMKTVERAIGETIRKLRKQRGLTLKELAKLCKCSAGFLSQIETGTVNPSLATLKSIADVLGISLGRIFSKNPTEDVNFSSLMKSDQRKTLTTGGGIQFQLLTRGVEVPFEFVLTKWPPGTTDGEVLHTHHGSECLFLIEGELDVQIGDDTYHLKPGDTITLKSSSPHRISNPGEKEALAIGVDSTPWIFSTK